MIESLAVLRGADHSAIIATLQNVWLYRDSVSANQRLMAFISLIHQLIRFYWCNEYFGAGLKFLISNREHLDQVRDTHALYRQNPNPTHNLKTTSTVVGLHMNMTLHHQPHPTQEL